MRLCPCRFPVPLMDNDGQPIEPKVILDLHRELLAGFRGFTIHPTSQGRWRSRAGRLYQEEVVLYEAAVPEEKVPALRDLVVRVGERLGQLAMYFDAPAPSVEIIHISTPSAETSKSGGSGNEPRQQKETRRRGKKNRPSS